jgi:hypothetical protein
MREEKTEIEGLCFKTQNTAQERSLTELSTPIDSPIKQ